MTQQERNMLEANRRLTDINNERLSDIYLLIKYITGSKETKEDIRNEIREIIHYYRNLKRQKRWKRKI